MKTRRWSPDWLGIAEMVIVAGATGLVVGAFLAGVLAAFRWLG